MKVLIVAETEKENFSRYLPSTVTASLSIGRQTDLLLVGKNVEQAAKKACKIKHIEKVLVADNDAYADGAVENIAALIYSRSKAYSHLIAAASSFSKGIMPRLAGLHKVNMISMVIGIKSPDTFERYIHSGNLIETLQSSDQKKILTIHPTSFPPCPKEGGSAKIERITDCYDLKLSKRLSEDNTKTGRLELKNASMIFSVGRGIGSSEKFKRVEQIAYKLNAAIGASRSAVDSGYAPKALQIGLTGKTVAPNVYIAIGISGAPQHLLGIKDSRTIISINIDGDAPIFKVSNYGMVKDIDKILPKLENVLNE